MADAPEKILVIQLRRVGDVVFTLPVLGALRRAFPKAKIDFLVEKPADQFTRLNPHLNETLVYEKNRAWHWLKEIRRRKYDWVLDFHANGRTLQITLFSGARVKAGFSGPLTRLLAYNLRVETSHGKYIVEQKMDVLRALGVATERWTWDLRLPADERDWAEQFLRDAGLLDGKPLVGIAPASRRETRVWLPERTAETAANLMNAGNHVLMLWGPGEEPFIRSIAERALSFSKSGAGKMVVPPDTSLMRLAALIQRCHAVLAVDNGPKNTAIALDVPTVTVDGPTNPLSFNPLGDPRHIVVRDETLHCIACGLNLCPTKHECMANVSVTRVTQEVLKLLEQGRGVS